ncbi:MAG: protein kinase [Candidatus Aminicenantes bacterium]|nr:MAG: protein kinase [Candidatus Aminicenantes bacterium]
MTEEKTINTSITKEGTKETSDQSPGTEAKTWGRFRLVSLLGTGGMGDVYKAYDPDLKRHIALKILRHEDQETLKRFLREARAQAQVEHRHVCKIYESGECSGHPYIAMQYIDGQTLKDLTNQLTLEEKLRIIKEVALGLQAAHRNGLIHRDVKPTNIMVTQTEEENWKPFIMDFGIAREQEASGLTSTGMVVGTPFYMSPEHAKSKLEGLDRRSDIYSLGVTLYELLTGIVPFQGDTPVEVLIKVIEKDPYPIRRLNPRIPVDIETIVMKCLEKDPNRRYSSAKELAEDIQRYLDGDPIQARPATFTYRIKRKLIKHKWPALLIGAALLVIVVLIGLWIHTQWAASRRAVLAQQLGQEVEKIESTIRRAHLLPLHNISREKNMTWERMKVIEEKMKKVGKMGLGPGYYAMGRGFMALQQYDKAKDHLEKAWEANYQTPEVAYELGRALGELYLKESEKVNRIDNKELREARKKEIEKTFREPAVRFLLQAGQIQNESQEYIEALISFYEKKFKNALTTLQKAMKKSQEESPWLYEAKILEGNIYLAIGREKTNYKEAMENFSRAEQVYQQVIKIGRSDIRGYVGLIRVLERKIMITLHAKGGDLLPMVEEAIAQCQKALCIDPNKVDVYVMESSVYRWLGRYQIFTGKNPLQAFNQSMAAARSALKLQQDNFEAYTSVGITNRYKAEYLMNHGQDPTGAFQLAAWNFNKAIEINPTYVEAYNGMGNVYVRRANYEMTQGKDPNASLEKAISTFKKALDINPNLVHLHNGLAGALWFKGGAMMYRGQDPRPAFQEASQSLKNAIKINPSFVHFYSNLGFVYMDMGRYELNYGFAPTDNLKMALKYFEKAVEINPEGNELYEGLVSVMAIQTKYDYMMGKDCAQQVSLAAAYFKRGFQVNPNTPLLYIRMAENHIIQARYQLDHHQSPLNMLKQADKLLKEAKIINPKSHEIYVMESEIPLLKARWALKNRQNPEPLFRKVEDSLKQAAKLNPKNIDLHLTRARLNWRKAEWKISLHQPSTSLKYITDGLTRVQQARSINPNFAETYAIKGLLLQVRSIIGKNQNSRLADERDAKDSLLKAIRINQNLKTLLLPFIQE